LTKRDIDVEPSDAIVVAGGQGPMFAFEKAKDLHVKLIAFYEAGKVAAALYRGVSILRYAMLKGRESAGPWQDLYRLLQHGRRRRNDLAMGALPRGQQIMPWRIEDETSRWCPLRNVDYGADMR
jgi:putative intracellular protease/amidase